MKIKNMNYKSILLVMLKGWIKICTAYIAN